MYINNQEILDFINKANVKISDLASTIVERNGDDELLSLLLSLSDFIECLDNEYNTWTEDYILSVIHYFNTVAALNLLPILDMCVYKTCIIRAGSHTTESIKTTSVKELYDFTSEVSKLIDNVIHNNTKELQGGNQTERYHLSKDAYDRLMNLLYPFIVPTVNISKVSSIPSATSGVYEKGTSLTQIKLLPSIVVNSGESITALNWYKGNTLLATLSKDFASTTWTYNAPVGEIKTDTYFRLVTDFAKGSAVQSNSVNIVFVPPIFYTSEKRGVNYVAPTKAVLPKSNQINITLSAPVGNSMASDPLVFKFKLPKAWGKPTFIGANGLPYNFNTSYKQTEGTVLLVDNSPEDYYLYELIDPTEGTFTLNIKY